ncbi:putative bifunctional diguanylate cyclase/phosphodiesterase [Novosphingobium olei]|uniref:putative bifunctional diguanylate cyclase/phosphodiesterase n=1 Tax=Novosphingobium olei TaxID=2728851 RepID=UPI00308C8637|nr:EAL domain-containing protein [Novosphingobium olei]
MIGKLRDALLRHPLAMVHLIRHEVEPADREWFERSRLHQIDSVPVDAFEVVRAGLMLLVASPRDPVLIFGQIACAALLIGLIRITRHRAATGASPRVLLGAWSRYLYVRAVAMTMINVAMLLEVSPDRMVPLAMLIGIIGTLDFYGQFTLPVPGVIAGWIGCAGFSVAMALRPEVAGWLVLMVGALQAAWIHVQMFNLNYMYATRRLRTRKLQTAHETIQLLLNQYDEHGSDWLVETDSKGHIVQPSDRLSRTTGMCPRELEGRKLVDLFERGAERDALRRAARQMKPFRDLPITFAHGDDLRHWSISGCPIYASNGEHRGFRGFIRDVTDRREAENRVRYLAQHDPLTGLANRAEFHARLEQLMEDKPRGRKVALLFIDLDHFKAINDSMGHDAGDRVLVETGRRLVEIAGSGAVVARLGGDEFAVILPRVSGPEQALDTADAFVRGLVEPIAIEGRKVQAGASVGVAIGPDHGSEGAQLLRAADLALYDAKAHGRGTASLYHEGMQRELLERRDLEADMRVAFAGGQFQLHYQPLHRLDTDAIAGFEALLRWHHPERGNVPPDVFIPIAEQSGLIVQIGEWVLREALAEAATWPKDLTVAVNVSAAQLRGGELLRQVVSALSTTGFDPRRLELEITETMLMEDSEAQLRLLHRLRALGVRIALDDFGTGYSSLNYLRAFPFDKIKIDRCFVTDLARNDESGAIVEAVLELAAKLNMQTIAEGVEDTEQLARLRERGCEQVQGYLFSRALPASDLPIEKISRKTSVPLPAVATIVGEPQGLRVSPALRLATEGTSALKVDCGN